MKRKYTQFLIIIYAFYLSSPYLFGLAPPGTITIPISGKHDKGGSAQELDWLKVNDRQVKFLKKNLISIMKNKKSKGVKKVSKVRYNSEVYWAKFSRDDKLQEKIIIPQAKILFRFKKLNVQGILHAEHFLELEDGTKLILFKKLPRGRTLFQMVNRRGPLYENQAIDIMVKLVDIVRQLHMVGIYHWDITPRNIWITSKGDVILFDFDLSFGSNEEFIKRNLYRNGTEGTISRLRSKMLNCKLKEFQTLIHKENLSFIDEEICSLTIVFHGILRGFQKFREYPLPSDFYFWKVGLKISSAVNNILIKGYNKKFNDFDDFLNTLQTSHNKQTCFMRLVNKLKNLTAAIHVSN